MMRQLVIVPIVALERSRHQAAYMTLVPIALPIEVLMKEQVFATVCDFHFVLIPGPLGLD